MYPHKTSSGLLIAVPVVSAPGALDAHRKPGPVAPAPSARRGLSQVERLAALRAHGLQRGKPLTVTASTTRRRRRAAPGRDDYGTHLGSHGSVAPAAGQPDHFTEEGHANDHSLILRRAIKGREPLGARGRRWRFGCDPRSCRRPRRSPPPTHRRHASPTAARRQLRPRSGHQSASAGR